MVEARASELQDRSHPRRRSAAGSERAGDVDESVKPVTARQFTPTTPLHARSAEQGLVRRNRHRDSGAAAYDVQSPGFVKGAGANQNAAMALLAERTTGETFTLELKAYRQGVVRASFPSGRSVAQPPDLTRVHHYTGSRPSIAAVGRESVRGCMLGSRGEHTRASRCVPDWGTHLARRNSRIWTNLPLSTLTSTIQPGREPTRARRGISCGHHGWPRVLGFGVEGSRDTRYTGRCV